MDKLVNLTLTDDECVDVRMALNCAAMSWGDRASAALARGDKIDADTCQNIRSGYHQLWEKVAAAQEAPPVLPFNSIRRDIRAQNG
jgi:hypothetical protein